MVEMFTYEEGENDVFDLHVEEQYLAQTGFCLILYLHIYCIPVVRNILPPQCFLVFLVTQYFFVLFSWTHYLFNEENTQYLLICNKNSNKLVILFILSLCCPMYMINIFVKKYLHFLHITLMVRKTCNENLWPVIYHFNTEAILYST